jgi:hypothetical protein
MNEIDEVLDRIDVPVTDVRADVVRGERALRRRHGVQVVGAAVAVVAVVSGGAAFQASSSDHTQPGFAGQESGPAFTGAGSRTGVPQATSDRTRSDRAAARRMRRVQLRHQADSVSTQAVLVGYRDVLAEHLDPGGDRLKYAQNEQGGTDVIGTKLDWNDGGMLEIVLGHQWSAAGGF